MLKVIAIAFAIAAVAFLVVVAVQPAQFRVERSATIAAPAPMVFGLVNDLHKWESWSPWAKRDPRMKQTYEGAAAGVGAVTAWSGNNEVGEGRMTITESRPAERVVIKLEFFRPFSAINTAQFDFRPQGDRTLVTWSMRGTNNFLAKAMHLFMDVDKMVGTDFEQGLANMNAVATTAATR